MVTMNLGKPGIFDTMVDRANTAELQRRHGAGYAPEGDAQMTAGVARDQGFGAQYDALNMFRQGAMGQGPPSAAQLAWQQQGQRNMTDSLALAARGRGGNIAGQQQQALASNAYQQQQTNAGMAQLRAQEQAAAQASYAGLAGQMVGQGFNYDQLGAQSQLQADQNALGWYSAERGMNMQQDQFSHQKMMDRFNMGMQAAKTVAGAVGGGMGGGMMSDERAKEGMRPTTLAASQAIGQITPAVFNYKPGMGPGGERIGIMAQDLERNPYTASLVKEGPDGLKRVDEGGLAAFATATGAEHEGRLRKLESLLSDDRAKMDIQATTTPAMQQQPQGPSAIPPTQPRERDELSPGFSYGNRMEAPMERGLAALRASGGGTYRPPPGGIPGEKPYTIDPFKPQAIDPFSGSPGISVKDSGSAAANAAATKAVPGPYVPNESGGAPSDEDAKLWSNFAGAVDRMGGGPMVTPVGQQMAGGMMSDKRAKKNVRATGLGSTISQQKTRNA